MIVQSQLSELIDKIKANFAALNQVAPGTIMIRHEARFQILATKILIREFERKAASDLNQNRR